MDILRKSQEILKNKIEFNRVDKEISTIYIIYFINNDDIVYIGKSADHKKYIEDKKDNFLFTHYSLEKVNVDIADNYMAELVIKLEPINNKAIPKNTKYISAYSAKEKYGVYKPEFKKLWNSEGEKLTFNSNIILEINIIQDATGQFKANHPDLPKQHVSNIIFTEDYMPLPHGGHEFKTLFDKDGNEVNALVDIKSTWKEMYDMYMHNYDKQMNVHKIIDTESFEAMDNKGKKYTLYAKDKGKVWTNNFEWINLEDIIHNMKEENSL